MNAFYQHIEAELSAWKENGNGRFLREIAVAGPGRSCFAGRLFCNLSSNDYLGLAGRAELRQEFLQQFASDWTTPELALTSSSSRLLTGNTPAYTRLEETPTACRRWPRHGH